MKEKILITSATGKTGFETTKQLLKDGYPTRVLVRSRNAKALELAKKNGIRSCIDTFFREIMDRPRTPNVSMQDLTPLCA